MKKFSILTVLATSILLTACAGGITKSESVDKSHNIKSVCLDERRTGLNYTTKEISQMFEQSLKRKDIAMQSFQQNRNNCQYVLRPVLKGKRELVVNGRLTLIDLKNSRERLGDVAYKYRGEEKERAQKIGIQGQIDTMVNELFK